MRAAVLAILAVRSLAACAQAAPVVTVDEAALREYAGTYQSLSDSLIYLQLWAEVTGRNQLVAVDESGEIRALFPVGHDEFITGRGAGLVDPIESRIAFRRDAAGRIRSLSWQRGNEPSRTALRVQAERKDDAAFQNGTVRLAGTLISPPGHGRHPTIVLVHAWGAEDREYLLPLTHFLIKRGFAVFGFDKRGVGASTGDWRTASFDDLAGDVVAAVEYLKTRQDVDGRQIGLFGWSQAGWVLPLAAVRIPDLAFLISVSGAGIPAAETTIDQTRNELRARGLKPETVEDVVSIMRLQYEFARTGAGWGDYMSAREKLAARLGRPPGTFPASQDDPYWDFIRRLYFYDPRPTLRRLRVPTLALFGEVDNNILAAKNAGEWESALRDAGNPDFAVSILPKANHLQLEASVGINVEIPTLRRFVPAYSATLTEWLAKHVRAP